MDPITNAILGISFLVLGIAGTVLMYWLWGFPYDHEKFKSDAPRHLLLIHRSIGYLYVIVYLLLMAHGTPVMVLPDRISCKNGYTSFIGNSNRRHSLPKSAGSPVF